MDVREKFHDSINSGNTSDNISTIDWACIPCIYCGNTAFSKSRRFSTLFRADPLRVVQKLTQSFNSKIVMIAFSNWVETNVQ